MPGVHFVRKRTSSRIDLCWLRLGKNVFAFHVFFLDHAGFLAGTHSQNAALALADLTLREAGLWTVQVVFSR